MLRQSRLSANDKGDNEMKPGTVHILPGICLIAEENPGKTSTRRPSDEGWYCFSTFTLQFINPISLK